VDKALLTAVHRATRMMGEPPLLLVWEDEGEMETTIKWLGHFQYQLENGRATWWSGEGERIAEVFRHYLG